MSERFTFRMPAWSGEAFAPGAFDGSIGLEIRVSRDDFGRDPVDGIVVAAKVAADGSEAVLTVEVPDGTLPKMPATGYSAEDDEAAEATARAWMFGE